MANKQIKDLTLKSNPATDDQLAIDESGGSTKKITVGSLPGENNRTLDAVPTDGNTANSVSSDGVFDALATKSATTHNHDLDYADINHNHDKLDYLTVTQAVDLDTLESDTATNNAKTGITSEQASAITANTAKTGITSGQANAITANTAHSGSTSNPHSVTATQVGLGNVDNTSDADKPVSTAQATADALALPKAGGTMTGTLEVPNEVRVNGGSGYARVEIGGDSGAYIDFKNPFSDDKDARIITTGTDLQISTTSDNPVKLLHNEALKLATTSTGINVTGTAVATTDTDTSNTGSVTLDFGTNQNFVLTLTGNVTLANPSTEQVGQSGFITFIQDGTGSRTVSLGTDYETAGGAGLTLTTTASATDIVPYVVIASGRILLGKPQLAFA